MAVLEASLSSMITVLGTDPGNLLNLATISFLMAQHLPLSQFVLRLSEQAK
jgi:hypothetical protein